MYACVFFFWGGGGGESSAWVVVVVVAFGGDNKNSAEKYAALNDIGPAAKGCACICVEASAPLCNTGRAEQAIAAMEAVRAGLNAMAIIDDIRKAFRKDPSVSGDEYRGVMDWEAEESKQEGGLPKALQVSADTFRLSPSLLCIPLIFFIVHVCLTNFYFFNLLFFTGIDLLWCFFLHCPSSIYLSFIAQTDGRFTLLCSISGARKGLGVRAACHKTTSESSHGFKGNFAPCPNVHCW